MAEGPQNGADREKDTDRLRDLEERLSRMTSKPEAERPKAAYDQAHVAWRMVIELVAGLGLGFGIGFGLDYLFGTTPFLMILFVFLGFAAGIKTMMRTASELGTKPGGTAPDREKRD